MRKLIVTVAVRHSCVRLRPVEINGYSSQPVVLLIHQRAADRVRLPHAAEVVPKLIGCQSRLMPTAGSEVPERQRRRECVVAACWKTDRIPAVFISSYGESLITTYRDRQLRRCALPQLGVPANCVFSQGAGQINYLIGVEVVERLLAEGGLDCGQGRDCIVAACRQTRKLKVTVAVAECCGVHKAGQVHGHTVRFIKLARHPSANLVDATHAAEIQNAIAGNPFDRQCVETKERGRRRRNGETVFMRNAEGKFSLAVSRGRAGGPICSIGERQLNAGKHLTVVISNLAINLERPDGCWYRSWIVRRAAAQMSDADAHAIAVVTSIRNAYEHIADVAEVVV